MLAVLKNNMKKRTAAISASVALALALIIVSVVFFRAPAPPITGAAIGTGWELIKSEELDLGLRWTYLSGNQTLTIREREFDSSAESSRLYLSTFASDEIKSPELFAFKDNAFTGVYYNNWWLKGPWLILVAQEGPNYYEIMYTNELNEGKTVYSGDLDTDTEWIKDLAEQSF